MVGRASADAHAQVRAMFETAAPVLAAVLERDDFLTQQAQVEQSLVESKDRQLTRLGLDLHDGPLQDVAALATDLRLFRRQLTQSLRGTEHERVLAGRMDDLEAQLVAVDADLRRLATSLQSPFLLHQDFPRALREAAESFSAATGIEPSVTLSGDLGVISESQQLALLAILREGLNNIREHSGARRVTISVTVDDAGVHAEMSDDGSGFDVESTLFRAARDGHVGLVGMQERVRLLNGRSHIESRPGGPTTITVSMPEWRPARP
jgi:signal transduction histidine kinase